MDSDQSSSLNSSFQMETTTKKPEFDDVMVDTDDDDESEISSRMSDDSKKQNHSEIEKRRRDKMNTFITELSGMIPRICQTQSTGKERLDKLAVLRIAVQHMKSLCGFDWSVCRGQYKPAYASDHELKNLILQVNKESSSSNPGQGFLFVASCDPGKLLYVSESVSEILNYSQTDLLCQSWFDILHPKDVAKVKEQLCLSTGISRRERLVDAKTMLPVEGNTPQIGTGLCPGARRSFFCRMKCKSESQVKDEMDLGASSHRKKKSSNNSEKKYKVMYCTGYLKSWVTPGLETEGDKADEVDDLCCLVAMAQVLSPIPQPSMGNITFISRYTVDCKFIYIDQRVTLVLGFLPQELLGTSLYEYVHSEDIAMLTEVHKTALKSTDETFPSQVFRFRNRDSTYVKLNASWTSFRNPCTKEIEYLIAKNTLVLDDPSDSPNDCFNSSDVEFLTDDPANGENRDIQHLISNQMEGSKIGKLIADEISGSGNASDSPSSSDSSQRYDSETVPKIEEGAERSSPDGSDQFLPSVSCVVDHVTSDNSTESTIQDHGYDHDEDGVVHHEGTNRFHSIELSDESSDRQPGTDAKRRRLELVGAAAGATEEEDTLSTMKEGIASEGRLLNVGPSPTNSSGGNDEEAMAVIMSLLEAHAGPVDFSAQT